MTTLTETDFLEDSNEEVEQVQEQGQEQGQEAEAEEEEEAQEEEAQEEEAQEEEQEEEAEAEVPDQFDDDANVNDIVETTSSIKNLKKKRRVSFAPDTIGGLPETTIQKKQEDDENEKEEGDEFINKQKDNDNANENDNDKENDKENEIEKNELGNLRNSDWKTATRLLNESNVTMSGSETSDNEMDFGKLTDRYRDWSVQYQAQQRREQQRQLKLQECDLKKKELKQNINQIKQKVSQKQKGRELIRQVENGEVDFMAEKYKKWKEQRAQRGVIFISGLPFGCTAFQLRKIFTEFGKITNVHLEAAKDSQGKTKKIYGKWTEYAEAWVEFEDKQVAKHVARILNGTKVPRKYLNNRMAKGHVWDMRYLKGFKWHHLLEHQEQMRVLEHKKFDRAVAEAHRQANYFRDQVKKAQEMTDTTKTIPSNKNQRGKKIEEEEEEEEEGRGGGKKKGNELLINSKPTTSRKRRREELQLLTNRVRDKDTDKYIQSDDDNDDNNNNNNNENKEKEEEKKNNTFYESSDDELPPLKKPKLIEQRQMQHRKTGYSRRLGTLSKSLWK